MPYSDFCPPLVWPDTPEGRRDALQMDPQHEIPHIFCSEFEVDHYPLHPPGMELKVTCRNRRFDGDRSHNWCHRCFVGYPVLTNEALSAFGGGAYTTALRT